MDYEAFLSEWRSDSPTVLVHTSGSTGEPKPMLVDKWRMEASARMTCRFLGLKAGDTALLCLPLDYIAGKMMVVRAEVCRLQTLRLQVTSHPFARYKHPECDVPIDLAAMVPLQVWNTLQVPEEREQLRRVRHLLIGGGAIDEALARQLADFPNYVWSTYGMTETLSHIALRRLNGPERSDWYTPFDGVHVSLGVDDCLVIDAPALHDGPLQTNDIAELQSSLPMTRAGGEAFRILGRRDNVICSGGIKIQTEAVEAALRPHLDLPCLVTAVPDQRLGQRLVLLTESADVTAVMTVCRRVLPRYWQPRQVVAVDRLPLTATGKPARAEARLLAQKRMG